MAPSWDKKKRWRMAPSPAPCGLLRKRGKWQLLLQPGILLLWAQENKKQMWENAPVWTMLYLNHSALPRLTVSELNCSVSSAAFSSIQPGLMVFTPPACISTEGQEGTGSMETGRVHSADCWQALWGRNGTKWHTHGVCSSFSSPQTHGPQTHAPSDDIRIQNSNLAVPTQC